MLNSNQRRRVSSGGAAEEQKNLVFFRCNCVFFRRNCVFFFLDAEKSCSALMLMARAARSHRLGPLHPSFNLLQMVKDSLLSSLPEDAHRRVSGRLCVSLTRVADGKNVLVSEFRSRDELVEVQSPRVQAYLSHASLPEDRPLTCPSDVIVFPSRPSCAAASSRSTVAWFHPPTGAW